MPDQLVVGIVLLLLIEKLQKHSFSLQHGYSAVPLRERITHETKNDLNARQRSLRHCKIPQQIGESWKVNCVFRLSLGLSTQIMEFEDKRAYKMFETGVIV